MLVLRAADLIIAPCDVQEQQDFLVCNAPENIKVQSQVHDGELSPDSNTGDETSIKRFSFPGPKQTQINLHRQGGASGAAPPGPLLLNTSASSASPKVRRPVLRSPVKFHPGRRNMGRVIVPPEVTLSVCVCLSTCMRAYMWACMCACVCVHIHMSHKKNVFSV